MSRFLAWLNSIGTSQLLLARQYGRFVEEFKRYWDREELRGALAPQRELFVTVAKRADRYVRDWADALENQLLAALPKGASTASERELRVALGEFRGCLPDLTALSVRRPAWMLTGVNGRCAGVAHDLLEKTPKAIRPAVEETLLRQVAKLGDRFWALLEQHRGNAWIAAEVIEEACKLTSATRADGNSCMNGLSKPSSNRCPSPTKSRVGPNFGSCSMARSAISALLPPPGGSF